MQRLIIVIAVILCCICCTYKKQNNLQNKSAAKASKKTAPPSIVIQRFDDFPDEQLHYVYKNLKTITANVHINRRILLPAVAYYKLRNRYRADTPIQWLSARAANNQVIIGFTSKDISCSKKGIADWEIFGLGYLPGNACIASCYRLPLNNNQQFFKVVIHEFGHTQGLQHCITKNCYMRDAEGKNTTNEEKDFCPSCQKNLTSKGWKI